MPMAHVLGKRNKISFENNFESNPVVVFIPGMNNLSWEEEKVISNGSSVKKDQKERSVRHAVSRNSKVLWQNSNPRGNLHLFTQ